MTASISFEMVADGTDSPPRELMCNIWPVLQGAAGKELGEPIILGRLVGVSGASSMSATQVTLPRGGEYLVEVELPNGHSTRRFISVTNDGTFQFAVRDRRYLSRSAISSPSDARRDKRPLDIYNLIVGETPQHSELDVRVLETDVPIALDQLKRQLENGALASSQGKVLKRVTERGNFFSVSLPSTEGGAVPGDTGRSWLRISGAGRHSVLIAYPTSLPLRGLKDPLRLAVRRTETSDSQELEWQVGLELMDPTLGALVECLNRRDIKSSQVILNKMYDGGFSELYKDSNNPVSAVASAYLFALDAPAASLGRTWFTYLQADHPAVPDLSIALGWWNLRVSKRGDEGWENAKRLLRQSLEQGLPYYTLGLHILVDALNLLSLAEPDDATIKAWLSIVTALDTACVREEPFTTLQISRFFPSGSSTSLSGG